jgi:hypothetical protein
MIKVRINVDVSVPLLYKNTFSLPENIIYSSEKYKVIFVNLGQPPMNIWTVQFDFDRPHIFVGGVTSPTNIRGTYSSMMWRRQQIYGA